MKQKQKGKGRQRELKGKAYTMVKAVKSPQIVVKWRKKGQEKKRKKMYSTKENAFVIINNKTVTRHCITKLHITTIAIGDYNLQIHLFSVLFCCIVVDDEVVIIFLQPKTITINRENGIHFSFLFWFNFKKLFPIWKLVF